MKKWALAGIVAVIAVTAVAAGAIALNGSEDGKDDGARVSRDADENDGTNVAPVCAPEFPDCEDTIVNPDGDVSADPDEPVSNQPPITIIDDQDPNECSFVHNITACEEAAIALVIEEATARFDASADEITVETIEFVEWPDSCLGIETPDVACAEVITPGFRIVLDADGQTYEYHTDGGSRAILVE